MSILTPERVPSKRGSRHQFEVKLAVTRGNETC